MIGVWPRRFDFNDPRAYVAALGGAVGMISADHLAFGTDIQGLAPTHTMMDNSAGMRVIVTLMLGKPLCPANRSSGI